MRNLCVIIVCFVLSTTVIDCRAASVNRRKKKSDEKLRSFTERYALPTNIHAVKSRLPLTFGYRFTDDYGTMQSREERTDPNGSKTGSYSFVDASGQYRRVDYVADHHGFRATVTTNEPGTISIDPAHVRMLTDNKKQISLGGINHATGNLPQLEYSSYIFSRYNLTDSSEERSLPNPVQSYLMNPEALTSKNPTFESERVQLEEPKLYNLNSYDDSPVKFPPKIAAILKQLPDPEPFVYGNKQNFNSNSNNYFGDPVINPDFSYDDKLSNKKYKKKVPPRYPRRQRGRAKRKHVLGIHIPKGYEDRPDLPLYQDK